MAKYVYPAVFTAEETGGYSIHFPDLEGCYTQGDDLAEGLEMAKDVLELVLYGLEEEGKPIPTASSLEQLTMETNQFASLIVCDTIEYRKYFDNRAIKKTLTIPNWLNTLAERSNLNFSQVLQEALKAKLDIP